MDELQCLETGTAFEKFALLENETFIHRVHTFHTRVVNHPYLNHNISHALISIFSGEGTISKVEVLLYMQNI